MRIVVVSAGLALWLAATVVGQNAIQDMPLTPANVHWGYYDAKLKPIATIASGGRFRIETMVAGGLQRLRLAGVTESEIPDALKLVEQTVTDRGPGAHPMTGPIFVDGAAPGDVLEIRIQAIDYLHPFGVNAFAPGGGVLPDEFPYAARQADSLESWCGSRDVCAGRDVAARAVLRIDRRCTAAAGRSHLEPSSRMARRQSR